MTKVWVPMAVLALAGAGGLVWQRTQIAELCGEVTALKEGQAQMTAVLVAQAAHAPPVAAGLRARDDDRQEIRNRYRDAIAALDLPPATAARLQNLLEDRVFSVIDAEDVASRMGFAMGSAEMNQAVATAIAADDRDIRNLLVSAGPLPAAPAVVESPPTAPPASAPVTVVVSNFVPQMAPQPATVVETQPEQAASPFPFYYPFYTAGTFVTAPLVRYGYRPAVRPQLRGEAPSRRRY